MALSSRHQVAHAVTIQIGERDANRTTADKKTLVILKRPVTMAQEHRNIVRKVIRHGNVLESVAIKIGDAHRARASAGGKIELSLESPIAITDQYGNMV